jgi:hypothetical protein
MIKETTMTQAIMTRTETEFVAPITVTIYTKAGYHFSTIHWDATTAERQNIFNPYYAGLNVLTAHFESFDWSITPNGTYTFHVQTHTDSGLHWLYRTVKVTVRNGKIARQMLPNKMIINMIVFGMWNRQ